MKTLLAAFYFFYFAMVGVYIIFLPKVLYLLGYSASEIGIIFASSPLVRFLMPFLFLKGFVLHHKKLTFVLVLMVASSLLFYFSIDNFSLMLLANVGLGVGVSLVLPYVEVIALESIKKENYGKIRLFGSFGFVLVALVLVQVLSDVRIAIDFLLLFTLLCAFVSYFLSRKKEGDAKAVLKENVLDINLFADWKLWLGLTLMQVSFGSFYNFFTIYATNNSIPLDVTIYLWSFGVLCEIIMFYYQGMVLKFNLLSLLQLSTLLTVFRWFITFAFPSHLYALFFAQGLHAFSFALFHTAAISYLFHFYKNRALAQQLFSGITYGLGGFIGALLAGYIYEYYARQLFLSSAIIAFGAFFFLYLWRLEKQ